MNIEEAKQILKYKEELAARYRDIIKNSPPGSIVAQPLKNGKTILYIQTRSSSSGRQITTRVPISEDMADLAKAIKLKQFCIKSLSLLRYDILSLKHFIKYYRDYTTAKAFNLLGKSYNSITFEMDKPIESSNEIWLKIKERQNSAYPENLKYEGPGGLYRSKSEVIIAVQLAMHDIPFKYEPAVALGDKVVYPDFVVFNFKEEKIIYWEHAGMMDDDGYTENIFNKLFSYGHYGINVGQNLILTTEWEKYPLSAVNVEKIVKFYFC